MGLFLLREIENKLNNGEHMKNAPKKSWRAIVNCGESYELRPYLIYEGSRPICEVNREDDGRDDQITNLISAAPDLLDALKDLVGEADLGEIDLYDEDAEKLRKARAAIAKAEGRGAP